MILLNGWEIAPEKIKRIQLGEHIIFTRDGLLSTVMGTELDLSALGYGVQTAPVESTLGFFMDVLGSPDVELNVVASGFADTVLENSIDMEAELYVHLTAPMQFNDPVIFVLDAEALAPTTAACEMDETVPIIFTADANAPATAPCDMDECVDVEFAANANAPATAQAEAEFAPIKIEAVAELRAANATPLSVEPTLLPGIDSELLSAAAVSLEAMLGFALDIEAELWIKPGEWTAPVLKNNVLGITQAVRTEQSGSILKIF